MPLAGFEPAIPANKRPQPHILDSGAAEIGRRNFSKTKFHQKLVIWQINNRGYSPILINCTPLFRIMQIHYELSNDREIWEENLILISSIANFKENYLFLYSSFTSDDVVTAALIILELGSI